MSQKSFEDFLKQQKAKAKEEDVKIDWNQQRQDWLDLINSLYSQVEEFFKGYVEKGLMSFSYKIVSLTEDNIGTYQIRQMEITIGNQIVKFVPIGTLLIGTKGRVDINGPRGIVRLILVDKDSTGITVRFTIQDHTGKSASPAPIENRAIDWTWKIVLKGTHAKFETLSKDGLFTAIMEVVNG